MDIKGSIWFSLMDGINIGIVYGNNGYEDKAYIGTGQGFDQKADEQEIAKNGTPFPVKQAREMI